MRIAFGKGQPNKKLRTGLLASLRTERSDAANLTKGMIFLFDIFRSDTETVDPLPAASGSSVVSDPSDPGCSPDVDRP